MQITQVCETSSAHILRMDMSLVVSLIQTEDVIFKK